MSESDLVREVLAASPVVDGHNDLPSALRGCGYDIEGLDVGLPTTHTDWPRLRAGGVGAQFWSVFVPSYLPEPEAVVSTLEQVDAVYRLVSRYPDTLALAFSADDVERAFTKGRIASLLGMEGGHSIAGSLAVLRVFARLGVRYLTLTHNDNVAWADSATDEPGVGGLNDAGRAVVAELNRIGILVDLSHTAATTQHAALDATTAPVIFSHSSARALAEHPRNVADDVLERLRVNGGVLQVTFVPAFISAEVATWEATRSAECERQGIEASVWVWPRSPHPGEPADAVAAETSAARNSRRAPELQPWLDANPWPAPTLAQVADHVEHAREVAGIEHVGLGGDYDGVDRQPPDLADVSTYPRLLEELAGRGWSRSDLEALTGRNVLRVLRDAEHVAAEPLWPAAAQRE